jgi:hypothetical protein
MANDGKIYIIITDKMEGGVSPSEPNAPKTKNKEKDKEKEGLGFVKHQVNDFIKSQAKELVSYSLGNYGNFTGNYVAQSRINNAIKSVSMVSNIGMATLQGASMGGLPGAVAAALISTASIGINAVLQYNAEMVQINKQNYSIEQLKKRAGLNSFSDGSRGTEN